MDKNSIIGFVIIGAILIGFTMFQSSQYRKQALEQAKIDSLANVQNAAQAALQDSLAAAANPDTASLTSSMDTASAALAERPSYKDSLLNKAAADSESFYWLSNDKLEVAFTTKGAQPYSVKVKDYKNYDSTDLYIFKGGKSELGFTIYAPEALNTKSFVFNLVPQECSDTAVVMRLPFANGGYIEQKYTLHPGSYQVDDQLSFVGMKKIIPNNVVTLDVDFNVTVPRMEKGYKNEVQYSKLDYYFPDDKRPVDVGRGRNGEKRLDSKISWFAFQQQFFSCIMRAPEDFTSGNLKVSYFPVTDTDHNLMACTANMRTDFHPGSDNITVPFKFYFGPNSYNTLKSFDQKYEKIIPLGGWLVGWFTKYLIIPSFNFLHSFISNYGLIILLMTIMIKLIVLPLTFKSYSSSAKMQAIKPEIDKLNDKYPKQEDAMKKQQATMELYKRAGISPMGGCLPMLLQFPVLWAMFRFFPASIELRQQSFLWAEDLSAYDSIWNFNFNIPLYGDHVSLFALLMAASMFLYSKMNSQQMSSDPNMAGMKFMSVWMMPIMMLFICNNLSAGLSYYYLLSNIFTMLETWVIKRFFIHPEAILAKLKASEGKPLPKSKWQQRLEDAQKMQRQAMKEQEKRGRR